MSPDGALHRQPTPATGVPTSSPAETTPELPEPSIAPDTEITRSLLRRLREARAINLSDISARTKVGASHLRAIEDERWEAMPAEVYLRGFLVEYARYMRLEVTHVTQSYLARYRKHRRSAE